MPTVRDVLGLLLRLLFARLMHRAGLCQCQDDHPGGPLWGEYDNATGSELIPLDDVLAHEHGDSCACLPHVTVDTDGDGDRWLVLHHAWDGRE